MLTYIKIVQFVMKIEDLNMHTIITPGMVTPIFYYGKSQPKGHWSQQRSMVYVLPCPHQVNSTKQITWVWTAED